jgi:uncharacterized protein (TIGR00369 family)
MNDNVKKEDVQMVIPLSLKPLPNVQNHKCFGCSPDNPHGLKMKFYTDDKSIFSWVTIPEHLCGWNNLAHGGVISTILDEIMGRSMIYLLKSLGLTKSMTVEFQKPVFIGHELRVEGNVIEVRNQREAMIQGVIYTREGDICAKSTGTFVLVSADKIRKMGISSEDIVGWFEEFILGQKA